MAEREADPIGVTIDGLSWTGWTSATINRTNSNIAGDFSLEMTAYNKEAGASAFFAGKECTVSIGFDNVITGYLDSVTESYSASGHTLSIAGRDKLADLSDCSETKITEQTKTRKLIELVKAAASPFGVDVAVDSSDIKGLGVNMAIRDTGQSALAFIRDVCKVHQVQFYTDNQGKLVLTRNRRPERMRGVVYDGAGGNVVSATVKIDHTNRFRVYRFAASGSPVSMDKEIRTCRVKELVADDTGISQQRLDWARDNAIAKSETVQVTVAGWRDAARSLWVPDALVLVHLDRIPLHREMLIEKVTYGYSMSGRTTQLSLVDTELFNITGNGGEGGQGA